MNIRLYRRFFTLFVIIVLGAAACSSGGGTTASPSPAPTVAVTTTTTASGTCPASAGLPPSTNIHGTVAASGNQLSIEASDFFFSPTCVTGVHSGPITLILHNGGVTLHNVSIPSLHIDMDMTAGQTITVHVLMGKSPLVFFCKYH